MRLRSQRSLHVQGDAGHPESQGVAEPPEIVQTTDVRSFQIKVKCGYYKLVP
jgi:hypothetical protein